MVFLNQAKQRLFLEIVQYVLLIMTKVHTFFCNPEDGTLTRLARVPGGRKGHEEKYDGHCSAVNAVAVTSDAKFYASGDDLNLIHIWTLIESNQRFRHGFNLVLCIVIVQLLLS